MTSLDPPPTEAAPAAPPKCLIGRLRALRRPIIFGHIVPDADCLGSAIGLAATLRDMGLEAVVGLPDGAGAKRLRFMFDLAPECPLTATMPDDRDGLIVVDTATEKRVNFNPRPDFSGDLPSLNIDHHITNTDFASINWVDPHASSASQLIARLIGELDRVPSAGVASLLYAGIHGDTAGFSLPSTSADALHTAADLVRAGADVTHIGEQLCRSQARTDFELLRRVYEHTTTTPDGQIAYSFLSHRDITESHCTAEDIDDQVSIPRALKGVRIAMLFSEGEPGVTRVNLRGEGQVSVIEIAQRFGGGGHTQSAGIRVRNRPMNDIINDVLAAAQAHLKAGLDERV